MTSQGTACAAARARPKEMLQLRCWRQMGRTQAHEQGPVSHESLCTELETYQCCTTLKNVMILFLIKHILLSKILNFYQ